MRWFKALLTLLTVGFVLSACSPSETDQRKAFIGFLQNDVLSQKSMRVPRPDAEKQKSFGDYARAYAIITDFHGRMDESVAKPMQETLAKAMPRSIAEVVERRADIATVRAGFARMKDALEQSVAKAEQDKAALKLPYDLAPVYAAAFDKLVTKPVAVFRDIFPTTDDAFAAILGVADLIETNRAKVAFSGSQIQVKDPALQTRLQQALNSMNGKQSAMAAAQQKLRQLAYGG
ncbi:DUF3053 family protein [Bosea beijingensis]|uniref:DUF3053 family protein n=1 Tax=Bosea beijingensis TaxID=3068632 RepID=UPI0027415495|nr:DUF3053 family protein [Bosea sp. REN20]